MKVLPFCTILMIIWSWQDENNINHNYYKAWGDNNNLLVLNWNHLPLVLTVRQTSANWCGELLSLLEDRDINKCGNWDNQAGQQIVHLKSHLISTLQVFWDRDITFFLNNKHNIIRWALLQISHLVQIGFLASKVAVYHSCTLLPDSQEPIFFSFAPPPLISSFLNPGPQTHI